MTNSKPTAQQNDLIIEFLVKIKPETHKKTDYPVKEFYKAEKVSKSIKQLQDVVKSPKASTYRKFIDQLVDKPELLISLYSELQEKGDLWLLIDEYQLPSVADTERLALKYTKITKEYEQHRSTSIQRLLNPNEKPKEGKTFHVIEYGLTDDIESLAIELSAISTIDFTSYSIELINDKPIKTTINGQEINAPAQLYQLGKIADKLETGTPERTNMPNIGSSTVRRIAGEVLAEMRKRGSTTRYPNIRGDEVAIPKEVLDAGLEGYTQTKETPDLLSSLDVVYRNEQERADRGGLAIQTELFKGLLTGETDTDIAPWATVDQAIRTLNIAGTTALVACVRYLHDNPKGGNIDLADLMAYDHKYKEQKESRRGLVKSDRVAFGNSLKLLLALNWGIKTKRSDRTSTIKYYRLINGEIEVDNTTGDVLNVRGLQFDNDFYDIKNSMLHVLAPKGIDYLSSPEAKSVALKVQSLFAKHQKNTIAGEPQKVSRDWLAKGSYKINARTNELIIKLLDDMVENNLIAKWHNAKGTKTLSGYDKDTYKILLYPTKEAQESYISPDMRKAERETEKQVQRGRTSTLKKVVNSYNNNDLLARELGASKSQLELWISGGESIPQHIADKIKAL